jgi:hypothetical protein
MRYADPVAERRPIRVAPRACDLGTPAAPPSRSGRPVLVCARWVLLGTLCLAAPHHAAAQHVTGQVVEELDGTPIVSALVHLVDSAGSRVSTTPTDQSGRFLLAAPAAGTWTVEVTRAGYEPLRSEPVALEAGALVPLPRLELKADLDPDDDASIPGRVILGRLLAEGFDDPLRSVMIRIASGTGEYLGATLTDAHGRFLITVVEPGEYEVQAVRRGQTATSKRVQVSNAHGASVTLELPYTSIQPAHEEIYGASGLTRGSHQFDRRREQGFGFHFDRRSIERLGVERLSELFDVPGMLIDPIRTTMGWQCLIIVYNHYLHPMISAGVARNQMMRVGLRNFTGAREIGRIPRDFDSIELHEVEGVEIYRSFREIPDDIRNSLHLSNSIWPPDQLGGCGFAIVWTHLGW